MIDRSRPAAATAFRKAWEQSLAAGVERLEDIAMERTRATTT